MRQRGKWKLHCGIIVVGNKNYDVVWHRRYYDVAIVQFWRHNYQRHNKFETSSLIGLCVDLLFMITYRRFWLVLWMRGTTDLSNEHKVFKPSKVEEQRIREGLKLFELSKVLKKNDSTIQLDKTLSKQFTKKGHFTKIVLYYRLSNRFELKSLYWRHIAYHCTGQLSLWCYYFI